TTTGQRCQISLIAKSFQNAIRCMGGSAWKPRLLHSVLAAKLIEVVVRLWYRGNSSNLTSRSDTTNARYRLSGRRKDSSHRVSRAMVSSCAGCSTFFPETLAEFVNYQLETLRHVLMGRC